MLAEVLAEGKPTKFQQNVEKALIYFVIFICNFE